MGDIVFKDLREYILENEFRINIYKDKVNIINYKEISHFSDTKILILYEEGYLQIKGDNLYISKLLNDEILINGNIKEITFQ